MEDVREISVYFHKNRCMDVETETATQKLSN